MRVRRVRVQPQQVAVGFGMPAASVQARSSRGPGSHCGGTVLTAPRVQSRGDRDQPGVDRRAHQRGVLVGAGDLGCQAARRRSSRPAPRPATGRSTTTDSRAPACAPPTSTTWPGGRQHPGQVGDRGRHRLSREEGQLTHDIDSRPAEPASVSPGRRQHEPPTAPDNEHPRVVRDGRPGVFRKSVVRSDGANAGGLRPLGALADLELDLLILFQGAETANPGSPCSGQKRRRSRPRAQ